jgi:hypothetical protein
VLDRRIDVSALPVSTVPWAAVLALAALTRLIGRSNWPLSAGEATVASDALALIRGEDISAAAYQHPFLVQATGTVFFLFGDTDYTARLVPLVASALIFGVLFWSRAWLGTLPALSIALLYAVSPTFSFAGHRLDGGLLLLALLMVLVSMLYSLDDINGGRAVTAGVIAALALASDPLAWFAAPVAIAGALIMRRPTPFSGLAPIPLAAGFAGALILTSTFLATRPWGIVRFFQHSFGHLWDVHISAIGESWFLAIMVLAVEEPFAVVFTVVALVTWLLGRTESSLPIDSSLTRAIIVWIAVALVGGILLGGKGPALYMLTASPLVVAGGFGLASTLTALRAHRRHGLELTLFVLALGGTFVALVRVFDHLTRGTDNNVTGWLLSLVVLICLIVTPLGYLLYRSFDRLGRAAFPAVLLAVAIAVGLISLRSSLLLPMTSSDRPGELLVAGSTAPSVTRVVQRIERYSQDVTVLTRDVRDPTGGHGLVVVLDEDLRQPFAWYFREFPRVTVTQTVVDSDDLFPDVIITRPETAGDYVDGSGSYGQLPYVERVGLPSHLHDPDWFRLLVSAVNPLEYRGFMNFVIYRETRLESEVEHFSLVLREDHASVFWGGLPR